MTITIKAASKVPVTVPLPPVKDVPPSIILALNPHFQWWTRKGFTDPVRVKRRLKKYEIRISKSETNPKSECPNVQNGPNQPMKTVPKTDQRAQREIACQLGICFYHWVHRRRIVSCFVLRISDLNHCASGLAPSHRAS